MVDLLLTSEGSAILFFTFSEEKIMNTRRQLTIQEDFSGLYHASFFHGNTLQWMFQAKNIEIFIVGVETLIRDEIEPPNKIVKAPNQHAEHNQELLKFVDHLEEQFNSSNK